MSLQAFAELLVMAEDVQTILDLLRLMESFLVKDLG